MRRPTILLPLLPPVRHPSLRLLPTSAPNFRMSSPRCLPSFMIWRAMRNSRQTKWCRSFSQLAPLPLSRLQLLLLPSPSTSHPLTLAALAPPPLPNPANVTSHPPSFARKISKSLSRLLERKSGGPSPEPSGKRRPSRRKNTSVATATNHSLATTTPRGTKGLAN